MSDPRDPDAQDAPPTVAEDAPDLVPETAPVDTSAAVGGDAEAAREAAEKAAEKGTAHFERREWAEALKAFRAAVESDPNMSPAWLGISRAECHMNGGEHCEAEYVPLTRFIKLVPNDAEAHFNLGNVQHFALKKPTEAEASYREAIRLDPKQASFHWNYACVLIERGAFCLAIRELRASFALGHPRAGEQLEWLTKHAAGARFNEGVAFSEQKNWPEALKAFHAAAEILPGFSKAWFNIGVTERDMNGGVCCEAEYAPLMRCIKLDPNNAEAHYNLGHVQWRVLKKDPEAEESFRETIRLEPKHAKAHNNLGCMLTKRREFAEGEKHLRLSIRLDPKDAQPHYNLGFLLEVCKDDAGAEKHFRQAIKLDPELPIVRHRLEALRLKQREASEQAKRVADSLLAEEEAKAAPTKPGKSARKKAAQRQKKESKAETQRQLAEQAEDEQRALAEKKRGEERAALTRKIEAERAARAEQQALWEEAQQCEKALELEEETTRAAAQTQLEADRKEAEAQEKAGLDVALALSVTPPEAPPAVTAAPPEPPPRVIAPAATAPPAPCKATVQISSLPEEVVCPITQVIMSDPVTAADGFTYERAAITDWLEQSDMSPVTGAVLPNKTLAPNTMAKKIAEWFMVTCEKAGADAKDLG